VNGGAPAAADENIASGWAKIYNLAHILKKGGFYSSKRIGAIIAHHVSPNPFLDTTAQALGNVPAVVMLTSNVSSVPPLIHCFRTYQLPLRDNNVGRVRRLVRDTDARVRAGVDRGAVLLSDDRRRRRAACKTAV
jgi:hypothetical protein